MIELYIIGGVAVFFATAVVRGASKTIWRKLIRPKLKGRKGEATVAKVLKQFSKKGGRSKNDILIKHGRSTSQIDHLLITQQGLLVIETKNYSGIIYGSESDKLWKQTFPDSYKEPRSFYNPIQQNQGHIHAIEQLLKNNKDISNVPIRSLVVFTGNCVFPPIPGVISHRELKFAIKHMTSGPKLLTQDQVKRIEDAIDQRSIVNTEKRSQHNFRAKLTSQATPEEIQELIERSKENAVFVSSGAPYYQREETQEEINRRLLTDNHAEITIRGKTDTIDGFFEKAKHRNDGQEIMPGGNFDYFTCPYTGDTFPATEALSFYQGLWIAYLNKHPELVEFMKEFGTENLGNSFRCNKVLTSYCADKNGYTAQIKNTPWYQNTVSRHHSKTKPETKPALSNTIKNAERRAENQTKRACQTQRAR